MRTLHMTLCGNSSPEGELRHCFKSYEPAFLKNADFSHSMPSLSANRKKNQLALHESREATKSPSELQASIIKRKIALISKNHVFRSRREMIDWIKQSCLGDQPYPNIFSPSMLNTLLGQMGPATDRSWTRSSTGRKYEDPSSNQDALKSLDFDNLSYAPDELVNVCVQLFVQLKLDVGLGIDRKAIHAFVHSVRNQMVDNPYHNWFHVADVTQTIYSLGFQSGMFDVMSYKEKLSLLVAALCHDLDHPGVNNAFLIKTRSALASLYSMHISCLEQHHSVRASELMTNDSGTGLLDGLCPADRHEIIARVQTIILATDMGRHGDYCARLKSLVDQRASAGTAPLDESQRQLVAELLIKCADTSNVLKPFPVAKRWAVRITDEFFKQGDLERSLGMEVSALCDRHSESRVALQKGFIGFIAPFYRAMGELLPGLAPLGERLQRTRDMWETYASDEVLLAEVSKESQWA